jgi:hypothetical protein
MATPEMRTARAFDQAYPNLQQSIYNWASHLDTELHNAGLDVPHYCEHRLRYAREYLAQFPDEDDDSYVNLRLAEGESLWQLRQQAEAEVVYQALVDKLPDKAWGYIGWADQYIWGNKRSVDYERAETLLLQALERPNLDEPIDVVYRLRDLYKVWEDYPQKPPQPVIDFIERLQKKKVRLNAEKAELERKQQQLQVELATSKTKKSKRNEPCWCGSGKKYKYCHMRSDKRGK